VDKEGGSQKHIGKGTGNGFKSRRRLARPPKNRAGIWGVHQRRGELLEIREKKRGKRNKIKQGIIE